MSDESDAVPTESVAKPRRRWIPVTIAAVAVVGIIVAIAAVSGDDESATGDTTNSVVGSDDSTADTAVDGSVVSGGSTDAGTTAGLGTSEASSTSEAVVGGATTSSASTAPADSSPVATESTESSIAPTVPPGTAAPGIDLGRAELFAALGNTGVQSTGPTTVTGQIGASNGAVGGFSSAANPSGLIIVSSQAAFQAQLDVDEAVAELDSREPTDLPAGELGAQTFGPGTYSSATLDVSGTVTLDGGGDPNAVFVFESPGTLTVADGSQIVLRGSAQACNVYWRLNSSATLGGNSIFVGTVIADDSVATADGSNVDGRLIARNGAVTLNASSIAVSTCA